MDEASGTSRQVQKLDGAAVPACSVTRTKQLGPRDEGEGDASGSAQLVWLPQSPGFSTAQASCGCPGLRAEPCGGVGFQLGGLNPQLTSRPRPVLHGQGIKTQLIFPAALLPATLSERARRCWSSELPPCPPRGTAPRCKGGGQLLGTARRLLSWESLKGPRTFSQSQLTFPTGCRMKRLLILSVLLGAVLAKEDFVG